MAPAEAYTNDLGEVSFTTVSRAIAIVGAKPNARYLTFSCELHNVGGLAENFVETGCTISLADRYSNQIILVRDQRLRHVPVVADLPIFPR